MGEFRAAVLPALIGEEKDPAGDQVLAPHLRVGDGDFEWISLLMEIDR
jgi:hypothetical protein